MKNFTKEITNKALFKPTRWLLVALMFLLGTSGAWAAVTIYFDNSKTKWSNVYIYLYSSTYWDANNGSGANNIKWCNDGQPMEHIGNNIYSFTYDGTHSGIVAFTKDKQCGYGNFWQTEACYSGTQGLSSGSATNYSTSKPCFTPTTTTITKNQTKYYKGIWSTYTPPCTTVNITWNNFDENMCINKTQNLSATASHGTVSYTSSSTANATISGTTLTAVKAGTSVITASVAASGNYCSASAIKTVNIINCIPTGTVLYLKPNSNWMADGARFALYLFREGGEEMWVDAEPVCNNDGYYQAVVPSGVYDELIWCRMNPATTANNWNDGTKWNQTGDLTYDSSKDLFTLPTSGDKTWDGATTTWSKWTTKQPCCTTADFSVNALSDLAVGCTTTASITGDKATVTWSSSSTSVASIDSNTGVITANAAGETTITATTTDANDFCSGTTKTTKLIVKNPSVSVKANKTPLCAGEKLTLTATVSNAGTGNTYQWYKGNNIIQGATSAEYTINSVSTTDEGNYKVVVNGGILCSSLTSTVKSITVNALPGAPTFDPAPSYCAGDEITLPIEDKAKNTVTWYKQDGSDAGTPLNTAGTYTYKAKATNTNGCVSADYGTYQYTVKAKVGLAWKTISTSMSVNNTQNITTTLTGTGDVVYTSSDNTVISVSGSTLKALKEGKATITATATGNGNYCGTATITKEVTVTCVRVNTPNVTASPVCAGSTATLTLNNRQDGVTYKLNSTSGTPIFGSSTTYTTPELDGNTTYKIYASHANACTNNIEGSVTVSVVSAPQTPSLSADRDMLNTTNTTATLSIGNYVNGVT